MGEQSSRSAHGYPASLVSACACPCLSSKDSPCTRSQRCPRSQEPSTPQCHGKGSGCQAASCGPARGSESPLLSPALPYHYPALIFFHLIFLSPCRHQCGLTLSTPPSTPSTFSLALAFDCIPTWTPSCQSFSPWSRYVGSSESIPPPACRAAWRIGKHHLARQTQLPHLPFLFSLVPWVGGMSGTEGVSPGPLPEERAWAASYLGPQSVGGASHVGWGREQRAKAWAVEIGTSWPSEAYAKDSDRQGQPHAHTCVHRNMGRQSLNKAAHLFGNTCGELLDAQPCSEGRAKEKTGLEDKESRRRV